MQNVIGMGYNTVIGILPNKINVANMMCLVLYGCNGLYLIGMIFC